MSPFRRCAIPTCPTLVPIGAAPWCGPHAAARATARQAYEQARQQDPAHAFYTSPEWRRFRLTVLAERPWCVDCGARASDVDHIKTVRDAPERALDPSNVEPRCHPHHSSRTSREHSWNRGRV
jgi:5-methylcytosine-specific restriction protein A